MENRQLLKWQPWLFLILGFFFPFQQAKTWKCHNIYLQSIAIGKLLVWSIIELQCHFPTYLHKQDTQYLPPFLVPKDLITVHLEINDQKVYPKSRTKSKGKAQRGKSDFMDYLEMSTELSIVTFASWQQRYCTVAPWVRIQLR